MEHNGFLEIDDVETAQRVLGRPLSVVCLINSGLPGSSDGVKSFVARIAQTHPCDDGIGFFWADDFNWPEVCRVFGERLVIPSILVIGHGKIKASFAKVPREKCFREHLGAQPRRREIGDA